MIMWLLVCTPASAGGRFSAMRTDDPSGPLDRAVESNLLRLQNGSELIWDVTALERSWTFQHRFRLSRWDGLDHVTIAVCSRIVGDHRSVDSVRH